MDTFGGLIQARGDGHDPLDRGVQLHRGTPGDGHRPDLRHPAVNQIELHPLLNQAELREVNARHNVVTEAYSPLAVGRLIDNPTVTSIAGEYGRTAAQVLIRWSIQLGNVVIPRSGNPERIASNFDVFDFELTAAHMEALNGLNDGTRVREDPLTYTGVLASRSGRSPRPDAARCSKPGRPGSPYPRDTAMNCMAYWQGNAALGGIHSAGWESPLS